MAKIRVKFCNINKTVPLKKSDIAKILSMYAVELKNRFELLKTDEKMPDVLWQEICLIMIETIVKVIPYKKPEKKPKLALRGSYQNCRAKKSSQSNKKIECRFPKHSKESQ